MIKCFCKTQCLRRVQTNAESSSSLSWFWISGHVVTVCYCNFYSRRQKLVLYSEQRGSQTWMPLSPTGPGMENLLGWRAQLKFQFILVQCCKIRITSFSHSDVKINRQNRGEWQWVEQSLQNYENEFKNISGSQENDKWEYKNAFIQINVFWFYFHAKRGQWKWCKVKFKDMFHPSIL